MYSFKLGDKGNYNDSYKQIDYCSLTIKVVIFIFDTNVLIISDRNLHVTIIYGTFAQNKIYD